ncbi:hypothetical protein [Bacillus marinisedimentorum]|nr:hypothetical protein [Bacillus marinisedimentorum]
MKETGFRAKVASLIVVVRERREKPGIWREGTAIWREIRRKGIVFL